MNFEMDKREFIKGLGLMQSVAGRKTTPPILSHILLEWENNSLYLTGTDLETGIREELAAKIHQKGKASVSAKKLYEIVRDLPEETIHIQKKDNQWITIQCGKSVFNLAAGANLVCRPQHLLQFAVLGAGYARAALGLSDPRVGLLSTGEEETKGNELATRTRCSRRPA